MVTLPSLKKNGYDMMEQEKDTRDLVINGSSMDSDSSSNDKH